MNENAGSTAADASGNGNEGVLSGGAGWDSNGHVHGALSFDGVDDVLSVPHSPELALGKDNADFSVALWVFLRGTFAGSFRTLLHKGDAIAARTPSLFLRPDSNRIHYRVSTPYDWNQGGESVAAVPLNTWTHLALVKSGTSLRLYFNGVLDSQAEIPAGVIANNLPLYIGDDPSFAGVNARIDEVRLYCRALSEQDLFDLVHLVGFWRFAEGRGPLSLDASAYHHDAMLGNASLMPSWLPHADNYALGFDGLDDILTVPDAPALRLGTDNADFSVALWVRLQESAPGRWRVLAHKGNANTARTFSLFLWPDSDRIHYRVSTPFDWNQGGDSVASLPLNLWTHVALVKHGLNLRLYLDGVLDSQVTLPAATVGNDQPLYIGDDPWFAPLNGLLDDLRLYDGALSPGLVAQLASTPYRLLNQSQPAPSPLPRTLALLPAGSTAPSATPSPALQASLHQGELRLRLPLPHNSPNPSLSLQSSPDLVHWQPLPVPAGPAMIRTADGRFIFEWRVPLASPTHQFLRVVADATPSE